ncbi:MAG: LptE family protein [Candidatus Omnitrophica bacterium]|nr:LptE family protein [Candidatus Omnitrophota bacterium]
MKRYANLTVLLSVLFIAGCGYTTGSLLPSHLKTIYVEDFKNKIDVSTEPSDKEGYRIYRAGLENEVTSKIIDLFIQDGHLQIVDDYQANLVLTGELLDYYKQPLRYDKFDNVEEYRIIVTVSMVLRDIVKDRIMWKEDEFIGYDTFRLTGGFASSEDEARAGAIKDLAEKVVEKVVEGW